MQLRSSRLLRQLRAGHSPVCLKLNLADPRIVELAGLSGADAVWICCEHVPNDWLNLENMIRAARVHDLDSIVRVAKGSYSDYVKPFEADATAIMVPHVASAEEARAIVDMTRFYPVGRRAMDGGNIEGRFCQIPVTDYIAHSNTERLLIFQIESPEALEQVEKIAAVPGFDVLLFGPGDFSHRIGKAGQMNAPEVVAARQRVAAAARAGGKYAMVPGMLAPRAELEREGWHVFTVGADVLELGNGFNAKVAAFHQQPAAPEATYAAQPAPTP